MKLSRTLPLALYLLFLLNSVAIKAQVSITTDNSAPDPKAMLDIKSTDKGLLIPRLTTAQRTALAATLSAGQKGLMVFDTETSSFWFYDGASFAEVGRAMTPGTGISISGTVITNTGDTDPSNDMTIGTAAGGSLTGTYPNPTIAYGAVGGSELATNAVQSDNIVDGTVGTVDLGSGAVTSSKIAYDAVTSSNIQDGTITAIDLAQGVIPASLPPSGSASGDLSASYPNPLVVKLRGTNISSIAPANGQILKYDASLSSYMPSADNNTAYTAGTGISLGTGTTITNTGLLTSTTAGGDVSGTFSNLQIVANAVGTTEIAANAVTNAKIGSGAATNGQVLTANGTGSTTWATPATQKTIADADGNTKIEVEKNANEDKIRLSTNGTERIMLDNVGNVGIGTQTPNANAVLDLSSTSKAFLPPRMSYAQIKAIVAPTAGMVAYDTEFGCLRFYNGTSWRCSDKLTAALDEPPGSFYGYQSSGLGDEPPSSCVTDASGNIYVCGHFYYSATFGATTLISSGYDIFIAKMNSTGTWLWAVKAGGSSDDLASSIAIDASNNLYVTGNFTGTATFGSTSLTAVSSDIFVAKINGSGTWQWAVKAGGSGYEYAISIALDAAADIYITGNFNSSTIVFSVSTYLDNNGGDDVFVAKLNNAGTTWNWAAKLSGTANEYASSMVLDGSGNIFITGTFQNTVNINGSLPGQVYQITSAGGYDVFVAKLNGTGGCLGIAKGGGTLNEECNSICIDASNNVYITGSYIGSATFGSTTLNTSTYGVFVAKLTGVAWQWAKSSAGNSASDTRGEGIATDALGNVYITGQFSLYASFGTNNFMSLSGFGDVFLAKLNTIGDWQWAEQCGGISADIGNCVRSDSNGNLTIVGYFSGTSNFGNNQMTSGGNQDVFVWKYSQ